ncbi:MAG TPA: PqqD family protein [Methylomirabilota bacterium]|jgi:hypothetical protein|nr:PqqD family protein [Methylomirabilota bacterium]
MDQLPGTLDVNRDDVAAKIIDGEAIIIRLSDGTYYSMDHVGASVWSLLEAHGDRAATGRTIAAWYRVPPERVQEDVDALVRELFAEGLVVAAPARAVSGGGPAAPPHVGPYASPRLNIHRDMGNLLALDPPTPGIDDLLLKTDTDEPR